MHTQLEELRRADTPLVVETIAKALGYTPATIRRVVKELAMPASFFAPAYSLAQVIAIADKLNAEQLRALEKKENHAKSQLHNQPGPSIGDAIASGSDSYRASLQQRREARAGSRTPRR